MASTEMAGCDIAGIETVAKDFTTNSLSTHQTPIQQSARPHTGIDLLCSRSQGHRCLLTNIQKKFPAIQPLLPSR
jgi:hypothetical protein